MKNNKKYFLEKYFNVRITVDELLLKPIHTSYIARVIVLRENEIMDFNVRCIRGKIEYAGKQMSIDEFTIRLFFDLRMNIKEIEMYYHSSIY